MMLPTYYLLMVMICSGILFFYYHLALRNRLFHQWNRFYLLAAVVLSLALPAIDWTVDKPDEIPVADLVTAITDVRTSMEAVTIEQEGSFSVKDLIVPAYALVSAAILILLVFSIGKIVREIRTRHYRRTGSVCLVDSNAPGTPFSFFQFIFWNNEIDIQSQTGKRILRHEMVHVHEWHSLDKVFMQLVLAVFWINPFFWLIRRELRSIHEFIADKYSAGEEGGAELAAMILKSSFTTHSGFITNQFFNTSIKRRIAMITKPHPRVSYFTRILALPVIAFIAFAFTVTSEEPNLSDKPDTFNGNTSSADTIPASAKKISRIDFLKNGQALIYFEKGSGASFEVSRWEWVVRDGYITQAEADRKIASLKERKDPLVVVNGEVKDEHTEESSYIFQKDATQVRSISAGEATKKYGEKGKYGAIEIVSPASQKYTSPVFVKVEKEATIDRDVWMNFILPGLVPVTREMEVKAKPGKYTLMMKLLVEADGSVSAATTEDYPELGIGEVLQSVLIKSPKWNPAEQNGRKVRSYVKQPITFVIGAGDDKKMSGPIYTQVDKPATVNSQEWRKFMDGVMPQIVKDSKYKGMKLTMSVDVRLLIGTDGHVEEAKVVNDEGLGVERALEKALLSSPLWEPARQDGEAVRVYVNQPIHIVLNGAGSALSNYPETDPEELKKMTIHQLLGLTPSSEIISCNIAIDQPNGDILEVKNTGNEFSSDSRRIISTAQKGLILTVDAILVKKDDGTPRKMPARVYKM